MTEPAGSGRPSLIHVIPGDGIGGVETAARSMAARDDLRCDAQILWVAGKTVVSDQRRMIFTRFRSSLNPFAHLAALREVIQRAPDVVVFSLWRTAFIAILVRFLCPRTAIVAFLHFEGSTHWLDKLFSRVLLNAADEVWADSLATLVARLPGEPRPSRVISFVTDRLTPAVSNRRSPEPRFVLWSRIHRQKGIDQAVELIDRLRGEGLDARFDIWGPDAGELATLQDDVDRRGLGDFIVFRGPADRSMLSAIAGDATFFLQPSRSEGMSMACVEAMQLGLVPVVTAVGEMATYVLDGKTGLIIDPLAIDKSAAAIAALLRNPRRLSAIRAAAICRWEDTPLYAEDVDRAAAALARAGWNRC